MTDLAEYRRRSRDRWSRGADGWGNQASRMQGWAMPVSRWLIDAIRPQPGQTVLELAAGPGDTGLLAAELIEPGGQLICSDFAEPMLEVARQRATEAGVTNVDFRVVDAESIDLDTASVDGVLCRWGYMLMADPGAALQETRRVLRPGGRVALAAWAGPGENRWASAPAQVAAERGFMPPPDPDAPSMFAFAPEGRIEGLLRGAGFGDVEVDSVALTTQYDDLDTFMSVTCDCSRPLGDAFADMDDAQRAETTEAIAAALAEFRQEDGSYRVPARTLVAAAGA
jgi:SAM-dependent methyltransferase